MTKFFHFLNTFIVLTIFVGIVALTFISLQSLSPVAYEDYLAYKGQSEKGVVAGISSDTQPSALEFTNLLETKNVPYQLDNVKGKLTIQFTIDEAMAKSPKMRLGIVSLLNKGSETADVYVSLDSNKLTLESAQLKLQPSLITTTSDSDQPALKLVEIKAGQNGSLDVTNLTPGTFTMTVLYYNTAVPNLERLP